MSPWGMISQPPAESISAISPGASSMLSPPWRSCGMAAALDDQEAVTVVVAIGMGGLAGDAPGVGADLRQLQAAEVLPRDIADEQRPVQRGLRFEAPADLAQRLVPGFEAVSAEDRVCTGHLLTATAIVIVVWRGNYRATAALPI